MSRDEFDVDPEECERAYQQILDREAFNDIFEAYQDRQTEKHMVAQRLSKPAFTTAMTLAM